MIRDDLLRMNRGSRLNQQSSPEWSRSLVVSKKGEGAEVQIDHPFPIWVNSAHMQVNTDVRIKWHDFMRMKLA